MDEKQKPASGFTRPALTIRLLAGVEEARAGAEAMAASEPWLTLRRDAAQNLELLNHPGKETFLALLEGNIAGLCVIDMNGPFAGYVQVLFVKPEFRGHGLGGEILGFAERRIFRESPNVFLCVSGFNAGAQQFYEQHGYERVGELKEYVVRGHSEWLMRKTIAPKSEFKPHASSQPT